MGSSEALGTPSDFVGSSLKPDATEEMKRGKTDTVDATKSESAVGNKRKRSLLAEEDVVLFTSMADAVNNVVDDVRSTKVEDSHPKLYSVVMFVPGFTDETLMCAYGHLLDNKPWVQHLSRCLTLTVCCG
jgi:hypothetical protein